MEIMTVQIKKTKFIMQFRILQEQGGRWFNGEKKAKKKKTLSGCSFIYTVSASNFQLIRFVIAHFFFPSGGSRINICYNTDNSLSPIKCGQKTFLSPLSISMQYSLGNFTYLKIIIDFLAIGFWPCGFWCRCKTHFFIRLNHVK